MSTLPGHRRPTQLRQQVFAIRRRQKLKGNLLLQRRYPVLPLMTKRSASLEEATHKVYIDIYGHLVDLFYGTHVASTTTLPVLIQSIECCHERVGSSL